MQWPIYIMYLTPTLCTRDKRTQFYIRKLMMSSLFRCKPAQACPNKVQHVLLLILQSKVVKTLIYSCSFNWSKILMERSTSAFIWNETEKLFIIFFLFLLSCTVFSVVILRCSNWYFGGSVTTIFALLLSFLFIKCFHLCHAVCSV